MKTKTTHKSLWAALCAAAASLALLLILAEINNTVYFPLTRLYEESDENIDLRQFDFSGGGADIQIRYFCPNVRLEPEEIYSTRLEPFSAGIEYASYYAVFYFPDNEMYQINVGFPGESGRIYLNGELVGEPPPLGKNEIWLQSYSYFVYPVGFKIELLIVAEGFPDEGVMPNSVVLYNKSIFDEITIRRLLLDSLYVGALLLSFLLLLCIWIFNVKMPQNLVFSLVCFIMAARRSVMEVQIFYRFFPDWKNFNIEYTALCLLPPLVFLYLSYIFPKHFHKPAIAGAFVCTCIYLPLTFLTPYAVYRPWLPLYQISVGVLIIYATVRLIQKSRRLSQDQIISLVGIAVLFVSAGSDMLYFDDIRIFNLPLTEAAMLVFVVTQMTALFIGNARITAEARTAEQRMSEQNAMLDNLSRMKTEFLQNISHELRTPLTVICNYALDTQAELQDGSPDMAGMAFNQTRIRSESERLTRMVNQLLDVTAIEGGRQKTDKRPLSLAALLSRIADANAGMLNENGNTLLLEVPQDLPNVTADSDAIERVVLNLFSNAARHTQNGTVTVSLTAGNGFQTVRVSDTGEGMPTDILEQVFLRYVERESKITGRSGLGLYICKKLIDAHGGEISIESEEGKGTKVWFRLPENETGGGS